MPEAYIYDHVRTPRGRGKADGSLHEVTALALATVPLKALKERNNLKEDVVDDVILGVVDPVGEAGHPHRQRVMTGGGPAAARDDDLRRATGAHPATL